MIIDITLDENKNITANSKVISKVSENRATLLKFHVGDFVEEYGFNFYLDFKKPNGSKFTTQKLNVVNNLVEYEITNSLLDESGFLQVEVVLIKDNKKVIYPTLWFEINESINATDELAPENKTLISEIEEVLNKIDTSGTGTKFLSDDGNIVVVAGNGGGIYYSTDGTNFIQATSPVTNDISASIYNNGLFILVGRSGTILTSEDGVNWVKRTINITTGLNDIFYDGKKYIVVGNSKVILTSNDGITWTNITTNLPSTDIQTIYYQDNYYIITASSNTLYYSKDLTSFTSVSIDKTCYAIVYFKDQLYISGSSGYVARASITDQKLNLQEVANYFMNKMNK